MPIGEQAQRFIKVFDYIVTKCENNPTVPESVANEDANVREAAEALNALSLFAAFEDDSKGKFARNISASFLSRWIDFKERWENECLKFDWLIGGLRSSTNEAIPRRRRVSWDISDSHAAEKEGDINDVISFVLNQLETFEPEDTDEEAYHEALENGVKDLRRLFTAARLDARQFFRRYDLLPFIHVPENVSKKHGAEIEFKSIYHYLRETQIAFAIGLDRAAYAMLRALLELVITKHYRIDMTKKRQLSCKFIAFKTTYADRDWFSPLFQQMEDIKEKGDLVLHFDKPSAFRAGDKKSFETHFASLFTAVKHLIQNAEEESATAV